MFMSDKGLGVIAKSKNRRCYNRIVTANDGNMVRCNNPIRNIVYPKLLDYKAKELRLTQQ